MSKQKHHPDEAEIRALDAEWSKAGGAKTADKIDQVVKFYATDGSVVWPDYPPAKGHAEIGAAWKKLYFEIPDMYLDFEPTHIEVSSGRDMACDFGLVHFARVPGPTTSSSPQNISWSGNANTAPGKYLRLLELERGSEGPPIAQRIYSRVSRGVSGKREFY